VANYFYFSNAVLERCSEMEELNRLILLRLTNPWSAVTNSDLLFSGMAWGSLQRQFAEDAQMQLQIQRARTAAAPKIRSNKRANDVASSVQSRPQTAQNNNDYMKMRVCQPDLKRIERLAQPRVKPTPTTPPHPQNKKYREMDPVTLARLTKPRKPAEEPAVEPYQFKARRPMTAKRAAKSPAEKIEVSSSAAFSQEMQITTDENVTTFSIPVPPPDNPQPTSRASSQRASQVIRPDIGL
jgi:hypothetical protein